MKPDFSYIMNPHFKFANQKLQYLLAKKTTYFNITEKRAHSPPPLFFSPNEIVKIKFACTQKYLNTSARKFEENLKYDNKKYSLKTSDIKLSTILESGKKNIQQISPLDS